MMQQQEWVVRPPTRDSAPEITGQGDHSFLNYHLMPNFPSIQEQANSSFHSGFLESSAKRKLRPKRRMIDANNKMMVTSRKFEVKNVDRGISSEEDLAFFN